MDPIFSGNNSKSYSYIAFFDLDRTIISEISGNALVRKAWDKGLMKWHDILSALYLYLLYKTKIMEPLNAVDNMVGWVKGKYEQEMEELCSEVCHDILLPSVYNEAVKEIGHHKNNNALVVLLSSALVQVCRQISDTIGIDDYMGTELEVRDGILTGKPVGRICFGYEKLERLEAYCIKNTMNLSDSWYYGDSAADLPALLTVGNPVCVNPDRELSNEARKRGWKILLWNH